jgi:DNA-binding transcriptional ArsR family regulator
MNIQEPEIRWDKGTAYDLFVSLRVIHRPDEFGLRPSWAAGVRSRIPAHLRGALEQAHKFIPIPLGWLHALPDPKDASTAVQALAAVPPEERLSALVFGTKQDEVSQRFHDFLLTLNGKQRLSASIEAKIKTLQPNGSKVTKEYTRACFNAWSDRQTFGELLLQAIKAYQTNFFKEEEPRIIASQTAALGTVKSMADERGVLSALEELSAGVRMDWASGLAELILAPTFWGAPFVFFDALDAETGIILFGARPQGTTLVPGDLVPENLLTALKALADPTRLRILRYLQESPCTPSELANLLRLRAPTVIHHLRNLRLAGLVQVTVTQESERCYAVRDEGLEQSVQHLNSFISGA